MLGRQCYQWFGNRWFFSSLKNFVMDMYRFCLKREKKCAILQTWLVTKPCRKSLFLGTRLPEGHLPSSLSSHVLKAPLAHIHPGLSCLGGPCPSAFSHVLSCTSSKSHPPDLVTQIGLITRFWEIWKLVPHTDTWGFCPMWALMLNES